ncbi:ras-related and estrogen-regulated growth inhibitor [Osmia lignaria lignaria]|uniref:ras-related and estrogen-regulated growth inhibitor n=1 Tax=Osmia lignaria lignaria TaxID=1437193 RepID=UPI00147846BA|nr:ras-related and estrogen-regulated growth inhibitor [Osmia lignaria]XP_034188109.1 ras-related and estrogen-regulated growth inhibitor [Osmia lignaria]
MERFSPPAASLKKRISPPIAWNLGLTSREPKFVKAILLGHQGVGKTALAVRFATKRYIGEYDCSTERIYKVDNFLDATWEITDPPGYLPPPTELKLRWADVIILVYSVSDRVSFDETSRLRFLVSHARKTRRVPPVVVLIANKADVTYTPGERVVSTVEGRQRAEEIEANAFHEISVRESVEQVMAVFTDISKLLTELPGNSGQQGSSFRVRASTDSTLNALRRPSPVPLKRRFSISVRGTTH